MADEKMAEIICPLCGKPNPPDLDECQYCQAPLKSGGFIAPPEGEDELTKLMTTSSKNEEPGSKATEPASSSNIEDAIPDWLKETEASFLNQSESLPPEEKPEDFGTDELSEQIDSLISSPETPAAEKASNQDDEWLASLLADAGVSEAAPTSAQEEAEEEQPGETGEAEVVAPFEETSEVPAEEEPGEELAEEEPALPIEPAEKPDWLTSLEAASTIKLAGGMTHAEGEPKAPPPEKTDDELEPSQAPAPDWLTNMAQTPEKETPATPGEPEVEGAISPAELPGWLEALRPKEIETPTEPTGPVEDVSNADIVTAGPLVGLRGVISPQSSAIRAKKPPTYSIKLRVTEEQKARVEMLQTLLADEDKPAPLPSASVISSRNIFRWVIVAVLLLPIMWMIISGSQNTALPQSGNYPGLVDFTQQIQRLPSGAPVLIAFDYEAGFSGEMNLAIDSVITQLMNKNAYLTLVATSPSGPALAESTINNVFEKQLGNTARYPYYANLGYIPGGVLGLVGLATSPSQVVPYALNGDNVWAGVPLSGIATIADFDGVIVLTNDADTARNWIEQVGPSLREANRPLLFVSSKQAEPLIMPYYQAYPSQVQGLIAGLAGGVAYARSVGTVQSTGTWDAYSVGITVSILVILVGSIASGVMKTLPASKKKES
jgi:hypothetical protein